MYCPKVLAGINTTRWPDTVTDRSIEIELRRKRPDEKVEKMRWRKLHAETEHLRAKLARWAAAYVETLRDADPQLPGQLDDRAAEGWEPLLAIADLAGGEHGKLARKAALVLAKGRAGADEAQGVVLLAALLPIFAGSENVFTETITAKLNTDDALPFGAYREGRGIDGRGLARLLKPFGVHGKQVRVGESTKKGYWREDFVDAWSRYCPPTPPSPAPAASDGNKETTQ